MSDLNFRNPEYDALYTDPRSHSQKAIKYYGTHISLLHVSDK